MDSTSLLAHRRKLALARCTIHPATDLQLSIRGAAAPRREVQEGIKTPYVRLFGYTRVPALDQNGKPTATLNEKTPMQVVGTTERSAKYGYTWRGLRRPRDRDHGVAGGELLIYDLSTREVLAMRRQFLISGRNPRGEGKAMWEVAASCQQSPSNGLGAEFSQFAFDVLQTTEPSTTRGK